MYVYIIIQLEVKIDPNFFEFEKENNVLTRFHEHINLGYECIKNNMWVTIGLFNTRPQLLRF